MADSPKLRGFGEIDLDLAPDEGADAADAKFGQVDLDLGDAAEAPPTSRPQTRLHTRVTRRAVDLPVVHGEDPHASEAKTLARERRAPEPHRDGPDAAVDVEYGGEQEIDLSDPAFGGTPRPSSAFDDTPAAPAVAATIPPTSGPLTLTQRHAVPRVKKAQEEIATLPIDHRGGFLLSHVDGMHSVEEILDVCAMPQAEALEIIANLESLGVIEFE